MSFSTSSLASTIARRTAEILSQDTRASRDAIVQRLLEEDGRQWDDYGQDYQSIVSEVMLGERDVSSVPQHFASGDSSNF